MRLNANNKKLFQFFEALLLSKTWLVMKICLILLLSFVTLAFSNESYSQNISLNLKNTKIEKIFSKIEKMSDYSFVYERNSLKAIKLLDVNIQNTSIQEALNVVFKNQPIDYAIKGKFIVISPIEYKNNFTEPKPNSNTILFVKITGVVKDINGSTLPSVSILNKKTGKVVATGVDGKFSIDAAKGDLLVFSYIGFLKQEIIVGDETTINIVLKEESNQLDQVVVTALGIKRAEKTLTYNIQEVKGEELTRNKDANFVNSLTGKIAGVTINSSSAGIGGATRVVMRGIKSISGNNNAMYVIDGVPVLNNSGGAISSIFSANTNTDIMSTINPEDIESISVLTGPAGAALYGKDGQNGVIVINTKSGRKDGKTSFGVVNNTTFYTPLVMPKFQNTYGQTDEGSSQSWGSKLIEPSLYTPKDFFQTGNNTTVGLNFSTGTEKNQTYFTADMVKANGIIPNNTVDRYNVSFRNAVNFLNDKLTLDVSARYSYQNEKNMIAQGLYHNPLVPIYLFPPGSNIEAIKIYERYDPNRFFPTQYWPFMGDQFRTENPWWIVNREPLENISNRLLFNGSLKYTVNSWLNIVTRGTFDNVQGNSTQKRYASTDELFAGYGGMVGNGTFNNRRLYADLMANINKKWDEFGLTASIGGQRTEDTDNSLSSEYRIPVGSPPNVFNTDVATGISRLPNKNSYQSIFATAGFSYKNMLFLDGSYRVDWDSKLYFNESSKLHLNYPALGASAIISDIFKLKSYVFSFIKLRANYAEAGNAPRPYIGGPQTFDLSGGKIVLDQTLHLPLTPERTKSWEIGGNFKFLQNKINLDVTLYNASTVNQIFQVSQSVTNGGYNSFYINAGEVKNKGIEASLGYKGELGAVKWNSNLTYTINKNVVKQLYNTKDANGNDIAIPYLDLAGGGSYLQRATVGRSLSAIYTTAHLRLDEKGYVLLPLSVDVQTKNPNYVGNADPKYTMGWNNGFSYKDFSLNFLIFARIGGVGVSATQAMMDAYGVSKTSADVRDQGSVLINGYPFADVQNYYTQMGSGLNGVLGYYVYSATNVRLKEVSLGYTLSNKLLHTKVVQNIKLAVTGSNLFMFYNKAPFDPESTASSGTYYQGFDYFRQPSLRGIGFNISAQF